MRFSTVATVLAFLAIPTLASASPDPPCFDNINRYVDCGNGTVTDTVTGLIWLRDARCLNMQTWAPANGAAAALANGQCSLTDNSSPGDWRLPTKDEWSATIARAVALGCKFATTPALTNNPGVACLSEGPSSFVGVVSVSYWSSGTIETIPHSAYVANLGNGVVTHSIKDVFLGVWPVRDVPALASAQDPPCFDNINRYVDCGNGTVTDTVTGLIWLRDAACLGAADWAAANGAAAALANGQCSLTDNSSAGDWRLPTKDEWSATIARAVALGCTLARAPSLTNNPGVACLSEGPSYFAGVPPSGSFFWSSTSFEGRPIHAWFEVLFDGNHYIFPKDIGLRVWPVRDGPS